MSEHLDFLREEKDRKRQVGILTSEIARRDIDTLGRDIQKMRAQFSAQGVSQPLMLDRARTQYINP